MTVYINITLNEQEIKVLMAAIATQKSVLKEARFHGTETYDTVSKQAQILDELQERLSELVNKAGKGE